jgi:hypothetical protein
MFLFRDRASIPPLTLKDVLLATIADSAPPVQAPLPPRQAVPTPKEVSRRLDLPPHVLEKEALSEFIAADIAYMKRAHGSLDQWDRAILARQKLVPRLAEMVEECREAASPHLAA